MDVQTGETDHRSLAAEELVAVAWFRNLSDEDKQIIPLILAALKEGHHSLNLLQRNPAAHYIDHRLLNVA
jgi:hypothetical protein